MITKETCWRGIFFCLFRTQKQDATPRPCFNIRRTALFFNESGEEIQQINVESRNSSLHNCSLLVLPPAMLTHWQKNACYNILSSCLADKSKTFFFQICFQLTFLVKEHLHQNTVYSLAFTEGWLFKVPQHHLWYRQWFLCIKMDVCMLRECIYMSGSGPAAQPHTHTSRQMSMNNNK